MSMINSTFSRVEPQRKFYNLGVRWILYAIFSTRVLLYWCVSTFRCMTVFLREPGIPGHLFLLSQYIIIMLCYPIIVHVNLRDILNLASTAEQYAAGNLFTIMVYVIFILYFH